MGKKKRTPVFVLKPWCWYCEREFEDDKVLLQHQKSKHFKCQLCPRKLNTAGGLMVHSQQVHKCDPEPLTNTLPGRDGYDIEIFGMEGVPTNALAEWKARKEAEAGTAALAAAAAAKRPRQSYNVISEADLMAALAQHKAIMARRENPMTMPFPGFPPGAMPPPFPPPFIPGGIPMPPPTLQPAGGSIPFRPPLPATVVNPQPLPSVSAAQPQMSPAVSIQPPKDGVIWPDPEASPAEKRAQQPRYRYTSPTPAGGGETVAELNRKRKAAEDFL